jgi:hypothetical protein
MPIPLPTFIDNTQSLTAKCAPQAQGTETPPAPFTAPDGSFSTPPAPCASWLLPDVHFGQNYILVSAEGYASSAFEIVVYDDGCGPWNSPDSTAVALKKL